MAKWEIAQAIIDGLLFKRSETRDQSHDKKIAELERKLEEQVKTNNSATVFDPNEIRRQRRREKNQLLRTLATAEKPSVQKLLEQEIADFDDETEELIIAAENKARKAAESRAEAEAKAEKKAAEAEAKAEKKAAEEKMARTIAAGAVLGIIMILFLVVFTPVRFVPDIVAGLALFGVAYGIYYWRWKK